ncbi:MAG: hypothetical protein GY710_12015 [Desulfobacteraceae bacterium]|nr:hypothetical protein [Desulfobacteraceae bacterium]
MAKKTEVDPAAEIYEVAQQDMKTELEKMHKNLEVAKEESFAMGVIKKIEYDNAHNEVLKYSVFYRIKQSKEYKKGGMTWKQFCEALGLSVRRVDEILDDIRPLIEKFSADFADLSGVKFSKIRYLGRSISADSAEIDQNGIVIDGETIPISAEHKDDIEAYIDNLKSSESKAKKEKTEEIKAKDRVIQSLHQTIKSQENDLTRYTSEAKPGELSDVEKEQLKAIKELKGQFDIYGKGMDMGVNLYLYGASEKVKAEYFASLMYARQLIEAVWDNSVQEIGISALPGSSVEDWQPEEYQSDTKTEK